jgi:hypothetical protein
MLKNELAGALKHTNNYSYSNNIDIFALLSVKTTFPDYAL